MYTPPVMVVKKMIIVEKGGSNTILSWHDTRGEMVVTRSTCSQSNHIPLFHPSYS